MTAINLGNIEIPDVDVGRVLLATQRTFGQVDDGNGPRDMTGEEIIERLRQMVIDNLERMVVATEKAAKIAEAEAFSPVIDIT